jgi:phthiodiolone/phenolphthiodiolone dimycocerosates ketoreductase
MDTEPYEGKFPRIWVGCSGPRMLDITGRYADGWWAAGAWTPEEYASKVKVIRESAERAGRDPMAITMANIQTCLIADDEAELDEILQAPLVKAWVMQVSAETMRQFGFAHPLGESWRGYQDIDPAVLPRERVVDMLAKTDVEAIKTIIPCGTPKQCAARIAAFAEAGLQVVKVMDYGAMGGAKHAATSARKVREAEDELMRLTKG